MDEGRDDSLKGLDAAFEDDLAVRLDKLISGLKALSDVIEAGDRSRETGA